MKPFSYAYTEYVPPWADWVCVAVVAVIVFFIFYTSRDGQ
jgi:hypothetical protein